MASANRRFFKQMREFSSVVVKELKSREIGTGRTEAHRRKVAVGMGGAGWEEGVGRAWVGRGKGVGGMFGGVMICGAGGAVLASECLGKDRVGKEEECAYGAPGIGGGVFVGNEFWAGVWWEVGLGFEDPNFPNRVYKVEKALYGLHQAPRAWYETFSTYLLDNGFQRGKIDNTLFIKRHKGDILLVQVYVDDIIFGLIKKELCIAFEKLMHEKFHMSSMGELTFFLGLQVK
ncbi:putative ribonuclease H-like domain-containing protein [Tanacetum coccineum]